MWVLRGFGALYLLGGVQGARDAWFWARRHATIDAMFAPARRAEDTALPRADTGRSWWLFTGAVLTAAAGLAMLAAHALAGPLLAAIVIHQLLYFMRQRRRELRAKSDAEASDARPAPDTVNGYFIVVCLALLTAWLYEARLLWW